jgi:hypothetical protein
MKKDTSNKFSNKSLKNKLMRQQKKYFLYKLHLIKQLRIMTVTLLILSVIYIILSYKLKLLMKFQGFSLASVSLN